MTTLIAVYNSDGCVGRCDAKCYAAVAGPCDCICGGKNHAAGLRQALKNVEEMVDPSGELRASFAQRTGRPAETLRVESQGVLL